MAPFHAAYKGLLALALSVGAGGAGVLVVLAASGSHPRGIIFRAAALVILAGLAGLVALFLVTRRRARASAGLAYAGRKLIEQLSASTLPTELCRTTVQVVGCDFAHLWLWEASKEAMFGVASFGEPAEIWDSLRRHRIPRDALLRGDFAALLADCQPGQPIIEEAPSGPLHASVRPLVHGPSVLCCVPLRRDNELIGLQIAGYRSRQRPFSPQQKHWMMEIGSLAVAALEHALARRQWEDANRLRSQLLAEVSHDLFSPINVIRGYTQLALDGEFGELSGELTDALRRIDERAGALEDLIKNGVHLVQLEAGQFPCVVREVAVRDLIAEVNPEAKAAENGSSVGFEWCVEDDIQKIRIDVAKVKIVLKNVMADACRFTRSRHITVEVRRHESGVEFAVRDAGASIPAELRAAIFEPFRRDAGAGKRRFVAARLGLYVSRRLVETMGGSIGLERADGQGLVFRIRLPAKVVAAATGSD